METFSRPDVILTHESDLDGFVSGHLLKDLARHLFGLEVRLEAWNTQAWRQRPLKERAAWVSDLAFDARLDRADWLVVDHHPYDAPPKSARLVHDAAKSASLLCYELCQQHGLRSPELDRLVALTDIGDLFRESDPDFQVAQDYASLAKTYSFWNLDRLLDGRLERLLDHPLLKVVRVRREVEDPIGLEWSRSRIHALSAEVGYVEIAVGNSNLIVNELLKTAATPYPVLLTLIKRSASGVVASLRSREGRALPIALRLQGGGHPNAAGATLPRSVQTLPDAVTYLRQVLNPAPAAPARSSPRAGALGLEL
ncbi:MAG: DHH family phosphoesterase [Verrucomicrobiales bacterium]|nr:DHH family phosphoesterase [Verrucomicrobiales bacterium]